MPGVSRHRVNDARSTFSGECRNAFDVLVTAGSALVGQYDVCDDVVGNREGDNLFILDRQENQRWSLDGDDVDPITMAIRKYRTLPMYTGWLAPPSLPTLVPSLAGLGEQSNAAWEALARTNPNVADVNLPTFVSELRDLPSLVKGWGDGILKNVANAHISWRWAIKPLMSDLRKLSRFQKTLTERIRWLDKLRSGQWLRRKASLGSDSVTTPWSDVVLHTTSGKTCLGRRREVKRYKRWATVSYKADDAAVFPHSLYQSGYFDKASQEALYDMAYRLAYGINSAGALATAWELTPWSWMTDWFIGVQTVMNATNNTLPLTHGTVCVMQTTEATREYYITTKAFKKLANGVNFERRIRKERRIVTPILPFQVSVPVCDPAKWSILGSLAILRDRNRARRG